MSWSPRFLLIQLQGLLNGLIGNADAGVAGEENEVYAHIGGFFCVFQSGFSAAGHGPHILLGILGGQHLLHRLRVNADGPSGQLFELSDHILRRTFGQTQDPGILHIKHVQKYNIRAHGGYKFGVGDVSQHRHDGTDGLAGDGAALAAGDGFQQFFSGHFLKIGALAVKNSFHW